MPWSSKLKLPGATPFEMLAAIFLVLVVRVAIFVDFIRASSAPGCLMKISRNCEWSLNGLFGTDDIGRSIFSRVLHGARIR